MAITSFFILHPRLNVVTEQPKVQFKRISLCTEYIFIGRKPNIRLKSNHAQAPFKCAIYIRDSFEYNLGIK